MSRRSRLLDVADAGKKALKELLSSGVQQVRVVLRALVLRELGEGRTAAEVAALVGLTGKTVRALARRYRNGGLERALYEKARPGKKRLLDASTGQRIVAMVCGAPPAGRARWNRAAYRGASRETENYSPIGPGNSTRLVGKPRA